MPTSCCQPCGSASAVISKRNPDSTGETPMDRRDSDALVLFGATGDLCYRKIFPALYHLVRRKLLAIPVIGVARAGWNEQQLAKRVQESMEEFVPNRDGEVVERL